MGIPKMTSISVILPAFNEAPRIRDTLVRTYRQLNQLTDNFQLVAVDDGSSDGTAQVLEKAAREIKCLKIVKLPQNRGKGEALRQGFYASTGDLIVFLDADMDIPPEQISVFLKALKQDSADVVIGSKLHPHSQVDYPTHRRAVSFIYFTITRILFGLPVRDTQTGLKMFRREVLELCMPRMMVKAFAYDLELLVIATHLGFRIEEAPVTIEHHPKYSRIPTNAMITTAIDTLAIFYRLNILEYYDLAPNR
jgi:glycosyltransferase involved in cell wall biosynthesis